jgi:peptidyl-prolyl cis-trans isomerase SurA
MNKVDSSWRLVAIVPSLALMACCFSSPGAMAQGLKPRGDGLSASPSMGTGTGNLGPVVPARTAAAPASPSSAQRPAVVASLTPQSSDFIVALVDSDPITNQEINAQVQQVLAQLSANNGPLPARQELSKQVLERVISERAQLQWAREQGIKVPASEAKQAEVTLASRNDLTVEEFRQKLASSGINPERFFEDLQSQLVLQRLREKEVTPRIKISDMEVNQYLKEQANDWSKTVAKLELAQIFLPLPEVAKPEDVQAAVAQMTAVKARLKAAEDFYAVAKEVSQGPERTLGGMMGDKPPQRYPDLFLQAVQTAQEGDVVGPLRSPAGLHLIKLVSKTPVDNTLFTSNQTHVRHILLRPTAQVGVNALRARLYGLKQQMDRAELEFSKAAKEISQDGSAPNGGDLGWAGVGVFVPEFEEAMNHLAPGEISDPVVSRFGVHLIQVLERRKNTMSAKEQREMTKNILRESKYDQTYLEWAQEVRGRSFIEYRDAPQLMLK